jgi:hypothetical protein
MSNAINLMEICKAFPCTPEAKALAAQYARPLDFVAALQQEQLSVDAVQVLARGLPKEKAVEWGAQAAHMAGEKTGLSSQETKTLKAAEVWIAKPDKANAVAAADAAAGLPADSPAGCVAQAAGFAEEVPLPDEATLPPFGADLTGHFAAGAVLLAAVKMSPEGVPETAETPEIAAMPEIPEMAEAAALDKAAQAIPTDTLLAQGAEQLADSAPLGVTPDHQAQASEALAPFLKLGTKLAETVPAWG